MPTTEDLEDYDYDDDDLFNILENWDDILTDETDNETTTEDNDN